MNTTQANTVPQLTASEMAWVKSIAARMVASGDAVVTVDAVRRAADANTAFLAEMANQGTARAKLAAAAMSGSVWSEFKRREINREASEAFDRLVLQHEAAVA